MRFLFLEHLWFLSIVLLATNPILALQIDLHFVQYHVTKGHAQISHIPSLVQVVDILTKLISSPFSTEFQSKLRIEDTQSLTLRGM